MNTMFAAISQRIKDIGVLRCAGVSAWSHFGDVFVRVAIDCALGGLAGLPLVRSRMHHCKQYRIRGPAVAASLWCSR